MRIERESQPRGRGTKCRCVCVCVSCRVGPRQHAGAVSPWTTTPSLSVTTGPLQTSLAGLASVLCLLGHQADRGICMMWCSTRAICTLK